jgi:tRNA-Thr(GGU) m(6)t(6)A37 methyltransferase TsaA
VIIITGTVVVDPEHVEEAVRLSVEHSARSRGEPGCLHHAAHRDLEHPDRIVFVEHWADRAAVDTHFAVPASYDFVASISALATEPPSIELFEADPIPMVPGSAGVAETFSLRRIGAVSSSIIDRADAPKQADEGAPPAWLVFDDDVAAGLLGVEPGDPVFVLTWLHEAGRDLLQVHSRGDESRPLTGVFSVRSPMRPNPIGLHPTTVVAVDAGRVQVAELEAIDGTPIVDLKPRLGDER